MNLKPPSYIELLYILSNPRHQV